MSTFYLHARNKGNSYSFVKKENHYFNLQKVSKLSAQKDFKELWKLQESVNRQKPTELTFPEDSDIRILSEVSSEQIVR
jgi:hypothetical protein